MSMEVMLNEKSKGLDRKIGRRVARVEKYLCTAEHSGNARSFLPLKVIRGFRPYGALQCSYMHDLGKFAS
jgi:hypothetical protein